MLLVLQITLACSGERADEDAARARDDAGNHDGDTWLVDVAPPG